MRIQAEQVEYRELLGCIGWVWAIDGDRSIEWIPEALSTVRKGETAFALGIPQRWAAAVKQEHLALKPLGAFNGAFDGALEALEDEELFQRDGVVEKDDLHQFCDNEDLFRS